MIEKRISQSTEGRHNIELKRLDAFNAQTLEQAKLANELLAHERKSFSKFSQSAYQSLFDRRFKAYELLLAQRAKYEEGQVNFVIEKVEGWGDEWVKHYRELNEVIIEHQLFLSANLDLAFNKLRHICIPLMRDNEEKLSDWHDRDDAIERASHLNNELYNQAYHAYSEFVSELESDLRQLRSRVDLDSVDGALRSN